MALYGKPMAGPRGFTIAEIVIAVVMIGIIAAITFPKLTQPGERVIAAEAFRTLTAIREAQNRYYAEHQSWAADPDMAAGQLDITIPPSNHFDPPFPGMPSCGQSCTNGDGVIGRIIRTGGSYSLVIRIDGKIFCAGVGCTALNCSPATGCN